MQPGGVQKLLEHRYHGLQSINKNLMGFLFDFLKKLFTAKQSNYKNIFAAKVVAIENHPNADRLRVVKLLLGDREVYPIVCGASNFDIEDIVALALPGAKIAQDIHSKDHQGFILEKAKIRGIESQGMICAAFELNLSNEPRQEIMVLKNDIKLGSQFKSEMIQ